VSHDQELMGHCTAVLVDSTDHRTPNRAQSGIGSLIILIAMLLVAVSAAGVFFDVVGSLQGDVDQTSEEGASQVTTRLGILNIVGTDISDESISTIEMTVLRVSGSGNIDLGDTVVQWISSSTAADLTMGETANGRQFSVSAAQDEDGSLNQGVLNTPSDRATLRFDAAAITGSGLGQSQTVTIQLTTQTGGSTNVHLVVPETLSGKSFVTL
jgi:flagellin FlaB